MLREYRLTNFKAFGETVTIPIRPLTLIFGANSSGKSSIFQSLLLLKQTLEESKNPSTALVTKGNLVDLGTYSDFVHGHKTALKFEVGARFVLDIDTKRRRWELSRAFMQRREQIGYNIEYSCTNETVVPTVHREEIYIRDETQPAVTYFPVRASDGDIDILQIHSESSSWEKWWDNRKRFIPRQLSYNEKTRELYEIIKNYTLEDAIKLLKAYIWSEKKESFSQEDQSLPTLPNHALDVVRDAEKGERELERVENAVSLISRLNDESGQDEKRYKRQMMEHLLRLDIASSRVRIIRDAFSEFLADIVHSAPSRMEPERYYTFSGDTINYIGQRGEHLPSLLFQRPELVEQINKDLERLKVEYQLKVSKLQYEEDQSPSNVFSLRLVDTRTKTDASIRDVGFGISQVLPIVVQSRLSKKKTLLIEQPEIHLHPAHQAELGDMFIRSALGEQKNTLLLETHSENLLLRIMRRMRETSTGKLPEGAIAVRPEDVMVLFVESDGSQSIVREMPLDERGELVKAWPDGFFEEGLREIL